MNVTAQVEADPPGLCLSVGADRESKTSRIVPLKPSAAVLVEALKALPGVREGWFAFHRWRTGRKAPDWTSASGTIVDLDHHMHDPTGAKPKGIKAPPPPAWREKLQALIESGGLPGNVFHHTANGERVYFLFDQVVVDEATYRSAYHGACALVREALEAAAVPLSVNAGDGNGYEVDPSVEDLAQWFWSPRAMVAGQKRDGVPVVLREEPYSPAELATAAPPRPDGARRTAKVVTNGARSRSVYPTLDAARDAFNRDHAVDWGPPGKGTCPICGHNDCFGSLPERPGKWFCFSEGHSGEGQRTERGWFGDALDVAAHEAGQSTVDQLRAEEYLAAEYREEPGCNDGDEPPAPESENPPGPGSTSAKADPWLTPEPFDRIAVPEFPTALLPDWQRRFVEAVALETETKPDLAAMCVLTATATACARRFTIEQRPGFHVPANLWTLTMLSSGNRKSAVFDRTVTPLREYEAEQSLALAPRIAVERSQHRRLERLLAKAEKAAVDAKEDLTRRAAQAEADELAEQLEKHKVTHEPCLFLAEATPERLEEVLMEQGGRAAVLASEPALLRALAGLGNGSRNGADPNLSSILDAHDGGDVRVGRMRRDNGGGGDRIVRGAVVTIGLAPQPERVFSALRAGPAFLESGFAWRFLFSLPETLLGHRTHATPPTPETVLAEYAARMRELLALPEADAIPVLRLTPEAHEALLAFERKIEPAMLPEGELAAAVPWASKLTSRLARIAGLLHAAENRREPWLSPVELRIMERAIALADYFIPHARAVLLELGSDPIVKRARRALEWIRREQIGTFTKHDLHRAIAKNEAAGAAESVIDPVLRFLADRDYIRPGAAAEKRPGRPPSPSYNVNPKAIEVKDGH